MSDEFTLPVPPGLIDTIAERVADRLAEQISPPPEPYINVDQAAEHLACDKRRIYDLKERGALVPFQDGTRLLFRRSQLDEYVSSLTPKP